ncbi:MAG: helix-hairpin-helix domain-containing protein [Dysgonamonadaceae bacterium]|jgi:DNA uptake protein ComE-like DNA-binding protein|nr:helix-hairpin-helix domain-containing protein [Dysgonamonadaceae bacterium]
MRKDFFYFTKKERTGILVFFLVIALVFSTKYFIPRQVPEESPEQEEIPHTASSYREKQQHGYPPNKTKRSSVRSYRENYSLHDFDPNTADSLTLRGLGIRSYIARNIVKYRSKGGKFRKPEDLSKIYGLDSLKFEELRPYIKIASLENVNRSPYFPKSGQPDVVHRQAAETALAATSPASDETNERPATEQRSTKYPLGTQVDIATADTTELKKIPRIGSAFANRIVKYRQLLGGYYCVEQIREVYGMSPELYQAILPWLKIGEEQIEELPVNTASVERLKAHPYIRFYRAKAIVDLRRKKGKLQSPDDLFLLEEFTEADLLRLTHYLSFH